MLPRLGKPNRINVSNRKNNPAHGTARSSSQTPKLPIPVVSPRHNNRHHTPSRKILEKETLQVKFQKVNEDEENQFVKLIEDLIKVN